MGLFSLVFGPFCAVFPLFLCAIWAFPAGLLGGISSKKQKQIDEYNLLASICRDSFYDFVQEFWETVIAETPIWNWHIRVICDELQEMAERVIRGEVKLHDLVANVPPGTSKSTIISIMFPAWVWTRMPSARFICGSYAEKLALDLARKNRSVITSEKYKKCFPEVRISPDQDTKAYFALTKGGMRVSVGSGGAIIGMHAHFVLVDDPIDPNAALSEAELRNTNRWVDETLSRRKVDLSIAPTILVMQRLHEEDPAAMFLSKGTPVRHICLPAELEPLGMENFVRPLSLMDMYKDGLLDPKRLPRQVLKNAEKELGPYGYACQYDQNPVPRGGGMFDVEKLEKRTVTAIPDEFDMIVRYWDKAATQGGGAWSVGTKIGVKGQGDKRKFYITNVVRVRIDSGSRETLIKNIAISDGRGVVVGIEQEGGSGGKESAESTAINLAGWVVRIVRPVGDKVARADSFSVQVNLGTVYLLEGDWNAEFIKELRHFPKSKFKDQVDSVSGGFTLLTEPKLRAGGLWDPTDRRY